MSQSHMSQDQSVKHGQEPTEHLLEHSDKDTHGYHSQLQDHGVQESIQLEHSQQHLHTREKITLMELELQVNKQN